MSEIAPFFSVPPSSPELEVTSSAALGVELLWTVLLPQDLVGPES